ncbi:hypothetical protein ACFP1I_24205 [Dyadobacter subterraneus]|uniref:Outer membrane protein beta-barrel domain-containing protein n=1 Tax=Dyadobacter subterraneus TaxID=2773304 RepID=A0ABR9WLQ8_9BACT|nr:hypothetical protein [Dyadobacter subterraneus]MBE9466448.1 hypothetical protein [Dyadobacter subterraneus]
MSKKNQHIKKYLNGKLPEPEVQADDAWGQMSGMLGLTSLPDSPLQTVGKFKYFLKYGLGLLSGVTIAAGSWLLIPESSKIKTDIKSHFEENFQDSIVLNETLEEVKPNITENLITENDSFQNDSTGIEKNIVIDSISNNKIYSRQVTDNKNQSVSTSFNNSAITLSNKKTNSERKEKGQKTSVSEIPESDHFGNTLKEKVSKENVSNRFSEVNKTDRRIVSSKDKDFGNNIVQKSFNSVDNKSSYFKEKNDSVEQINDIKSDRKIAFSVKNLIPKSTRFPVLKKNSIVTTSVKSEDKKEENKKVNSPKPLESFHIGLEWNAASSFKDTKYLLPGPDSTDKPYRLLIPGIWISKDINDKQSVTASFFVSQQYFAGNKMIKRTLDSTIKDLFYNTKMIKAVGINLSLQYNYQVFSNLAFSAGLGYSKLNRALFQESMTNYANETFPTSKLSLKKPDLGDFVQTNLVTFKTGILFNPGRFQLGVNLIIPITNVSSTSLPIRTLNGQVFFRFRLK